MYNIKYMKIAIDEAKKALNSQEIPVAAVIVSKKGEILSKAHNDSKNNPIGHAEIIAIQEACKNLGQNNLSECSIYITLEPCIMCSHAISLAHIDKIYFGAYQSRSNPIYHSEVYGGIIEKECSELVKSFFNQKRKK